MSQKEAIPQAAADETGVNISVLDVFITLCAELDEQQKKIIRFV